MPIELEYKFLLEKEQELWETLEPMAVNGVVSKAIICQGYLSKGGRIRQRDWVHGFQYEPRPSEFIFTYKHELTTQPGDLEIETALSEEDYRLAWSEADHKITKMRYLLPDAKKGVWEVDFFYDDQGIYLALAEFEVPANHGPPDRLHPLVSKYLKYSVPLGDSRFKNRKLCTRERGLALLQEIV
jgi:CYTH domain-containing protein